MSNPQVEGVEPGDEVMLRHTGRRGVPLYLSGTVATVVEIRGDKVRVQTTGFVIRWIRMEHLHRITQKGAMNAEQIRQLRNRIQGAESSWYGIARKTEDEDELVRAARAYAEANAEMQKEIADSGENARFAFAAMEGRVSALERKLLQVARDMFSPSGKA